jgi:hypothetical protein
MSKIDFKMILMYPTWRAGTYIFIFPIEFLPWMPGTLSSCIIVSGRISHTEPMAMASRG